MFTSIELSGWRQFDHISIQLDPRLTVLTGENGTGKTTILNLLSRHFGWPLALISSPLPISSRRSKRLYSDFRSTVEADFYTQPGSVVVGGIHYSGGTSVVFQN